MTCSDRLKVFQAILKQCEAPDDASSELIKEHALQAGPSRSLCEDLPGDRSGGPKIEGSAAVIDGRWRRCRPLCWH